MAYTAIDDPEAYFQTKLYTGDASTTQAQTLDGTTDMQPDMVWIKQRNGTNNHMLADAVRGANNKITPNENYANDTGTTSLKAFNSDGFSVGSNTEAGGSSTYVAWCWKANGSGATNEAGSINTIKTSANTTSGFSISTFTGTGANATIGHGIGIAPHWVIVKKTSGTQSWSVFHIGNTSAPETENLYLNTTAATSDSDVYWQDTLPSTTLITLGSDDDVNASSATYISYAFAPVQGFSKFGSYTGNGSSSGSYIHLGFRAAMVIVKRTDSTGGWYMYDNKRAGYNGSSEYVQADTSSAGDTNLGNFGFDILSNGFKLIGTYATVNASGGTYVYMAFAEQPFVNSNGVPNNAR